MKFITSIISAAAVTLFGLGYLQKKRRNIVLLGAVSRVLYVVQYLLAGAFAGAVLDVLGAASAIVAGKKDTPFLKKYARWVIAALTLAMLAAGVALAIVQKKPLELLPMVGVALQAGALWLTKERDIRRLSLLGTPFWLIYNLWHLQSGSLAVIGDVWSLVSLGIAMARYDLPARKQGGEEQ